MVQNGRSKGGAALIVLGRGYDIQPLAWGPGPTSVALGDPKHPNAAEIGSFIGAIMEYEGLKFEYSKGHLPAFLSSD